MINDLLQPAPGTLLLKRSEVAAVLKLDECIAAVEAAFKLYGEGKTAPPGILGIHSRDGGFHIKAGLLEVERPYFVAKTNANFSNNPQRAGLPAIQGAIMLCDGENGSPLALMDSIEITIQRTGAATAVAAKYLARPESKTATICGCGNQGRIQLRALAHVLPLARAFAFDRDEDRAKKFTEELSRELLIEVQAVNSLASAVRQSEVCVTCTPSRQAFLQREDVAAGTFIAAVGADSENKHELTPQLMAASKIVTDVSEQCATIGDLHHALAAGLLTRKEVHAELGEIVAGKKAGRVSSEEIIVFDSTGMALQDAAAAILVYKKAVAAGIGLRLHFAE